MIRARFIAQVRYGHFAEYLKAGEQLNEIARERAWAELTFWVSTAGTAYELFCRSRLSQISLPSSERVKHMPVMRNG
jgi:hypothetical protein